MGLVNDLESLFNDGSEEGRGLDDFLGDFVDIYISYGSELGDMFGNKPIGLKGKKSTAVNMMKVGISNDTGLIGTANAVFNGLSLIWTGISLEMTGIPIGWVSIISNVINVPGVGSTGASMLVSKLKNVEQSIDAASVWAEALETFTSSVSYITNGLIPGAPNPLPAPPIIGVIK